MMNTQKSYENKRFSVLGDSISTLDGYSEPADCAFYKGIKKIEADVFLPEDCWWGQVISRLGGTLLVNNSISGSMVCKHPRCEIPSYGCSPERTSALGKDGANPHVILVYLGTNDWGAGMKTVARVKAHESDLSVFSAAYQSMLDQLKQNYPEAEIWCFTLAVSTCSRMEGFEFPYRYVGRHIEEYCDVIRDLAAANGCRLIDLYANPQPYDTIDGFHPNRDGMQTLAEAVMHRISDCEQEG